LTTREVVIQVFEVVFEVVERLTRSSIVGVVLKRADPGSLFLPVDELDCWHRRILSFDGERDFVVPQTARTKIPPRLTGGV